MSDAVLTTLITTGLGAVGLEVVRRWFDAYNRAKKSATDWTLREAQEADEAEQELRRVLQAQIDDLRTDMTSWRNRYFELQRENQALREQHAALAAQVNRMQQRRRAA